MNLPERSKPVEENRLKVVVTQRYFDSATIAYLEARGCCVDIIELPGGADKDAGHDELVSWLKGASGWIVGHARVTRELLSELPDLRVVARRGVGYDRLDLLAIEEHGAVATITPGSSADTVADQTVGMMIALGRRFRDGQNVVTGGEWDIPVGTDLYGKTVGVVGYGRIGAGVVRRVRAFDASVLVTTPRHDRALAADASFEYSTLADLLERSDYVTLHAPLTDATRFIIRDETLALMKTSAFVINTARGGLVEDRHLLAALENGKVAGAGLDVFLSESDSSYGPVTAALAALPNVIAQPHSGASTNEALARTNMMAATSVVAVLFDENLPPERVVADGRRQAR